MMDERRKYKRYAYPFPLKYCPAGRNEYLHTFCGNISMGGLMFVTEDPLELTTPIEMVILKSLEDASAKIELQGEVVWCSERETEKSGEKVFYLGIEFLALMKIQMEGLKSFIELYCKSTLEGEEVGANDARGYFIRGLKKFQMGNMQGCIQDFSETLNLDPNHQAACLYRAFAKDKTGDDSGATQDFQRANELSKGELT